MDSTLAKKIAAIIFYGSFTVIPSLVWVIANFYEHISYTVLALMAIMPMFVFQAIRGILEEAPPAAPQPVASPQPAAAPQLDAVTQTTAPIPG